jgi:hypothetical protein
MKMRLSKFVNAIPIGSCPSAVKFIRGKTLLVITGVYFAGFCWAQSDPSNDPIKTLVGKLDLQSYKATIKALTKFGDRREGTDRNRAAVDWIEAQLKSYGCTSTERIRYDASSPAPPPPPQLQFPAAPGGGVIKGNRASRKEPANDADVQPDVRLRELNWQPSAPGPREEVFCTKIGATHPEEMYIVGAHMDGKGWGEAANDDASGTALVMEIARILSAPEVVTERSIRFALWNGEDTGMQGSLAYVDQRKDLQGKEDPPGSGKYPEPRWLGMIQHDMMLFDHGMPHKDGTVSDQQRPEADVNIEFQSQSKFAAQSAELAWTFRGANEKYATDYPAQVGHHMANTDSLNFQDLTPAISLRELERGTEIGAGWDPTHHQPTNVFTYFSDGDFRLGLNATQTTLGAVAQLAGARLLQTVSSAK